MEWMKKRDVFIIIGLLILAGVVFVIYNQFTKNQLAKAEIYYESELVKTISLKHAKDETFTLPQDDHVVFHLFSDGSICFEESDCPDKVCIRSGRLRHVGQTAACLPNKFIIKIVPDKDYSEESVDLIG